MRISCIHGVLHVCKQCCILVILVGCCHGDGLQQKKAVKYDVDERDLDNLFFIWVTAASRRCLISTNYNTIQHAELQAV